MWSPGRQTVRSSVSSAARPLANASPRAPPSSAASAVSSAARVGLRAAAVLIAAAQPADPVLLVGRCRIDRDGDGPGDRVGILARRGSRTCRSRARSSCPSPRSVSAVPSCSSRVRGAKIVRTKVVRVSARHHSTARRPRLARLRDLPVDPAAGGGGRWSGSSSRSTSSSVAEPALPVAAPAAVSPTPPPLRTPRGAGADRGRRWRRSGGRTRPPSRSPRPRRPGSRASPGRSGRPNSTR